MHCSSIEPGTCGSATCFGAGWSVTGVVLVGLGIRLAAEPV
jgi:hypothetical protein